MKKMCCLLVAAAFILNAAAQDEVVVREKVSHEETDGAFLLGVRYMPTVTSFDLHNSNGGVLETSFLLSHGFGGLVGYTGEHVGVQAELIYNSLAQKFRDVSMDREIKLSYIQVPLMLVLNTGYSKPVNLNIAAGPQFSFNTGSSITAGDGSEGDTVHAVVAVKPADVGFAYGAGLDFGFGSSLKLSIGYRGVIGLVDISDKSKSLTTNEYYVIDRSHVRTYAGYVGLTFGF